MKSLALLVLLLAGGCAQASAGGDPTDRATRSPAQSAQPYGAVALSVDCPEVDPAQPRCGLAGVAGRSGSPNGIPTPASQGINVGGIGGYNMPASGLGQAQYDARQAYQQHMTGGR